MREPASDSSEDLYSYNATTTDIFDFTASDAFSTTKVEISQQTFKVTRFFKLLLSSFANFFVGIFKLSLEFARFLFYYFGYLQFKVLALINFFGVSKDKIVSTLMWRRGLLFRPATHGGVMVVAAVAIVAGGLFTRGQIAAQDLTPQESALKTANTTQTIVPTNRPRSEVITYKVVGGDTLSTLAEKFEVSTDSIKWANGMTSDAINPEQTLRIPPVSGVVHKVKDGDTLATIAKAYTADTQTIADFPFNYIDDTLTLKTGQDLFVPGGAIPKPVAPKVAPAPARPANRSTGAGGSGFLAFPTGGRISQYFSWFHPAIDIAAPNGTPIYAAAAGRVIDAKKQTYSFGWYCIIDHGNGYTAAYAHMSAQACYVGQQVVRGQYIGGVGATGRATGTHLHFEVRRNGSPVNPMILF